jgi:hypothetical protein
MAKILAGEKNPPISSDDQGAVRFTGLNTMATTPFWIPC